MFISQQEQLLVTVEHMIVGNMEEVVTTPRPKRVKLNEEPLPDPFPLPDNHRPDVDVALKTGKMTVETRKAYMSQIAASIFTRKRYPTREELQRVALDVVKRYPFLQSPVPGSTKTVCS